MTSMQLRTTSTSPLAWRHRLAALALLTAAYAALGVLGLRWATVHGAASPVFPAAGVAVAGLVLGGARLWPAVFVGTIAAFAVSGSAHPWWVEAALAGGNALAAVLAAASLRRVGLAPDLGRIRDALALVGIGAVGASTVAATVGAAVLWASVPLDASTAWLTWSNWFFGDVVGVLTAAPLVLAWGAARPPRQARWWAHLAACSLTALAVALGVFVLNARHYPIGWYLLVPLIWAAFAFRARGSVVVLLVAATAVAGTTAGTGPFAADGLGALRFVMLQQFLAVAAAASLILAALVSERDDKDRLRDSEARSRRQLQELDTLYQTAPIGMWLGDRQCRFLRINEVAADIHGYPVRAHLGRTLRELAPWVADIVEPHYRRVLDTGQPALGVEIVARAPAQPDVERTWLASYCPVFGERHEVAAVSVTVQEITEHRRAQAALLDADRRKDEFLATLAHELRNPLAPIRTGLRLLKRAPTDSPAAATAREMMERQLLHMVRLVDDLLDVSRISRGKIDLRRERLELGSVIDTALEASRPNIDAGRHALVVRRPAQPVFLQADAARLSQVVSNLLNNAAKYTPEGGRIELAASREGAEAVVQVSDTGMGIARDMLPRVFEIFTQVGRTLDRAQGGLGIGLSLVKRLVELHGGSVRAESPGLGQGSTFTVRLPLAPMRATDQPAPACEGKAA